MKNEKRTRTEDPQRLKRQVHRLVIHVEVDDEIARAVETGEGTDGETARDRLNCIVQLYVAKGLEELRTSGKARRLVELKAEVRQLEIDLRVDDDGGTP